MKREKALLHVIEAIERALYIYDYNNVDVVRDDETNMLDVIYHSRHNSFPIEQGIASFDDFDDIIELEFALDNYEVGYVW